MTEPTSNFKSSKPWFYVFLYGICMGIADIIPGISGGTIAFIMGFYKDLIESLKSINFNSLKYALKGDFRLISWEFLLALGSGIVFAFLTLIHLFNYILSHLPYREYLYASFCGLIAASAFIFAKKISRWSFSLILFFMLGLGISFALTNFQFCKSN